MSRNIILKLNRVELIELYQSVWYNVQLAHQLYTSGEQKLVLFCASDLCVFLHNKVLSLNQTKFRLKLKCSEAYAFKLFMSGKQPTSEYNYIIIQHVLNQIDSQL